MYANATGCAESEAVRAAHLEADRVSFGLPPEMLRLGLAQHGLFTSIMEKQMTEAWFDLARPNVEVEKAYLRSHV